MFHEMLAKADEGKRNHAERLAAGMSATHPLLVSRELLNKLHSEFAVKHLHAYFRELHILAEMKKKELADEKEDEKDEKRWSICIVA